MPKNKYDQVQTPNMSADFFETIFRSWKHLGTFLLLHALLVKRPTYKNPLLLRRKCSYMPISRPVFLLGFAFQFQNIPQQKESFKLRHSFFTRPYHPIT